MSADDLAKSLDDLALRVTLPLQIQPQLSDDALVSGFLSKASLASIVGASNSGKSALALDLATAIAMGMPFRGMRVARSAVLYVAAEGGSGFRNRVAALLHTGRMTKTAPLGIVCDTLNLCHEKSDAGRVANASSTLEALTGEKVGLIVIDTVARVMGTGDENSAVDMGSLITNIDSIRTATDATLLLVHHLGKDASRGARGHSCYRAALDTEITVDGATNPRRVSTTKQRDYAPIEPFTVNLVPVALGTNDYGETVSAITIEHSDTPVPRRLSGLGKNQSAAVSGLREWAATHSESHISSVSLTELLRRQSIVSRQRRLEVTNFLVNGGLLTKSIGGFTVERAVL